jgi:hypothetical protein
MARSQAPPLKIWGEGRGRVRAATYAPEPNYAQVSLFQVSAPPKSSSRDEGGVYSESYTVERGGGREEGGGVGVCLES